MKSVLLVSSFAAVMALSLGAAPGLAQRADTQPPDAAPPPAITAPPNAPSLPNDVADPIEDIQRRLTAPRVMLLGAQGQTIAKRQGSSGEATTITEADIINGLQGRSLPDAAATALWSFFADEDNSGFATLPVITAMVKASNTPKSREALYGELAELARQYAGPVAGPTTPPPPDPNKERAKARERSLLGQFERNFDLFRGLLTEIKETDGSADEMMKLMVASQVFGWDRDASVTWVAGRIPAQIALKVEEARNQGKPLKWEWIAFEAMMKWKNDRIAQGATKAPATLEQLDAMSETFVMMFNRLHGLDEWYRTTLLKGLGPVEVYNAVVGGEQELYRLGTSSYRSFLHPVILKGIKDAGSFEAFIERATPKAFGDVGMRNIGRRGMVFVRVAASFGLLDTVLETVRDRTAFIEMALNAVSDPATRQSNSTLIVDVLTTKSPSASVQAFQRLLLDRVHRHYVDAPDAAENATFGSMLAVYQTMTGDIREPQVGRLFPLDSGMFNVTFDRLFSRDAGGGLVHRMFMRMHDDIDGTATFATFRPFMASMGGSGRDMGTYHIYRLVKRGRIIEIYVNKPTPVGVKQGIADIQRALTGKRVETIIGRGHTSIIQPLQTDSRQVLGARLQNVATVIVGACGGDASVQDLIRTFGHVAFVTTRSTGRQVLNNAVIESYIAALAELAPGRALTMQSVVDKAVAKFLRPGTEDELREDALLYRLNRSTVLTSLLLSRQSANAGEITRAALTPAEPRAQ